MTNTSMKKKDPALDKVSYRGWYEDEQRVTIKAPELHEPRWCREVLENEIQTKRHQQNITIEQSKGPGDQVDVIGSSLSCATCAPDRTRMHLLLQPQKSG
jgi:hypothetical protein